MNEPLLPGAIDGWVIDDVVWETSHAVIVAARAARVATDTDPAIYATLAIARPGSAQAARHDLGDRTGGAPLLARWGSNVTTAFVVTPSGAAPSPPTLTEWAEPVVAGIGATATELGVSAGSPSRRGALAVAAIVTLIAVLAMRHSTTNASADVGAEVERTFRWDSPTATATLTTRDGIFAFHLGEPGDTVALGDWNGDGQRTPALYAPTTGDVWLFDDWAQPGHAATARFGVHGEAFATLHIVHINDRDVPVLTK